MRTHESEHQSIGCSCTPANAKDEKETVRKVTPGKSFIVLSGKGGVGKSTVAVNLAEGLAQRGSKVGLLDIDFHGPSVPTLLGLQRQRLHSRNGLLLPVEIGNLKVVSIGFLLEQCDDPVIWRGPMKAGVISQFLQEVLWGDLDYLIIDAPPGTGDEALSICQTIPSPSGAIVVTTPQEVALADVRRSVQFCKKLEMPITGVIENMSGFLCPHCGEATPLFRSGGGKLMAKTYGIPFLGSIPIAPEVGISGDEGSPLVSRFAHTAAGKSIQNIIDKVRNQASDKSAAYINIEKEPLMKIALPLAEGRLCMHFGHCEEFAIVDIDEKAGKIKRTERKTPPPHEPGVLPAWLGELGVTDIIAGGMGRRAQDLFLSKNIKVVVGAPPEDPEALVLRFLHGELHTTENICDH